MGKNIKSLVDILHDMEVEHEKLSKKIEDGFNSDLIFYQKTDDISKKSISEKAAESKHVKPARKYTDMLLDLALLKRNKNRISLMIHYTEVVANLKSFIVDIEDLEDYDDPYSLKFPIHIKIKGSTPLTGIILDCIREYSGTSGDRFDMYSHKIVNLNLNEGIRDFKKYLQSSFSGMDNAYACAKEDKDVYEMRSINESRKKLESQREMIDGILANDNIEDIYLPVYQDYIRLVTELDDLTYLL